MIPHWKNKSLKNLTEIIDGELFIEKWKSIRGLFNGLYEVSNFGRVKSLSRERRVLEVVNILRERIMSLSLTRKGYVSVTFHNNGIRKTCKVHRLVGILFIPNPKNLPEINHTKGIKTDNRYHQLEWNTHQDNCDHAVKLGLTFISDKCKKAISEKNKLYVGAKHYMSKVVLNNQTGVFYDSAQDAANSIKMNVNTLYPKLNGARENDTNLIYV